MIAKGLLPAAAVADSARLGAALSRLIEEGTYFSAPVIDHGQRQTRGGQGREPRDDITDSSGSDTGTHVGRAQVEHPEYPGRDVGGRWLKGTCGYPPIGAFDTASRE
jgi:hypothetical protein